MPLSALVDDDLRVEALTLDVLHRDLDAILSIDRETSPEMLEPWSPEHFFVDLPGKWRYSMLATDTEGVAGFEILSVKGGALHLHRIVVRQHLRRHGVGTLLLAAVAKLARCDAYRCMTAKVALHNDRGLAFQMRLGARVEGYDGRNMLIVHDLDTLATQLARATA